MLIQDFSVTISLSVTVSICANIRKQFFTVEQKKQVKLGANVLCTHIVLCCFSPFPDLVPLVRDHASDLHVHFEVVCLVTFSLEVFVVHSVTTVRHPTRLLKQRMIIRLFGG